MNRHSKSRKLRRWSVSRGIYEFAAQNISLLNNTIKWFVVSFVAGAWKVRVEDDFYQQRLPHEKDDENDGIMCSPLGETVVCGATKKDCAVWYSPDGRLHGAGQVSHVQYNAHKYGTYQVPTGNGLADRDEVWYSLVGRAGFNGMGSPGEASAIARGVQVVDGKKVLIEVYPTGKVVATELFTGNSTEASPTGLPAWTWGNELGLGHVWGAWRLNSTAAKAVSVLHGNPWLIAAMDAGFDVSRILDPNETPDISGAFQSAIFELSIAVSLKSGVPSLTVTATQIGAETGVLTAGLVFGYPEQHSDGEYYYAADYSTDDEIVWAKIKFWMRDIFEVDFTVPPHDPACPYKNIHSVTVIQPADINDSETWLDPCGIGGFGTRYRNMQWAWRSIDEQWVRTRTIEKDVQLQFSPNLSIADIQLVYQDETSTLNGYDGHTGSTILDLWSNGTLGSLDLISYGTARLTCSYAPCTTWHVVTGGGGDGIGAPITGARYELTVTRDDEVLSSIIDGIDLRAGVVLVRHNKRIWNGDDTGWQTAQGSIAAPTNINAYLFESGYADEDHYSCITPDGLETGLLATTNTVADQETSATSNLIAENYSADQTNENDYPLITRLWAVMVLGKPNPKTPDGEGGFIGPFANWGEYYPYQMITNADSINAHDNGAWALRWSAAGKDVARYLDSEGMHETSHDALIDQAVADGNLSSEEAAKLKVQALTTRGEWL